MAKLLKQSIIGIIPARFGSSRFPGKPLTLIKNKTLIQRTYESALKSNLFDELIIATDDKRIFDHVKSFNADCVMTSIDCPTGTDRLAEVVSKRESLLNAKVIVNIQGDEPLIDKEALHSLISLFDEDENLNMGTCIAPLNCHIQSKESSIVKCVFDKNKHALYFSRQQLPFVAEHGKTEKYSGYRHIGIYAYKPSFLKQYAQLEATPLQTYEDLEQLKVLENGYKIKVAIVNHGPIGVDTPEDVKTIEKLL